ncbi:hypothetical protein [Microbacterium testaceum]|uniref:hypothetical protein n=1 Tax=Microbacterium testaceum TaxID=2033 RepID=UPI001D176B71|nr:hypothetical protein [Microbacterium testaceum]MCC4250743.1 hypothetical protein [Microbacterium testaceum]
MEIEKIIAASNPTFVTEDDLQRELADVLSIAGWMAHREVRLSDGVSRIDLLLARVGIEVKIDGAWRAVTRQLLRYARCDEIDHLILVTTRPSHQLVPSTLNGKPVTVVVLTGGSL